MSTACANFANCSAFHQAFKNGDTTCGVCDVDVEGTQRLTRALDPLIDRLKNMVEKNSPEVMAYEVRQAAHKFQKACADAGLTDVSFPEAALAIQLRTLSVINDLEFALQKGHG